MILLVSLLPLGPYDLRLHPPHQVKGDSDRQPPKKCGKTNGLLSDSF